jgi:poly(A) polymerase
MPNSLTFATMQIVCTDKELMILEKIAAAADELNMPCYLIGGFVRDKIIGRSTKDADIVCMGDGIELAHKVAASFHPKPTVAYFKTRRFCSGICRCPQRKLQPA